jgi:hypothetical protein
MASIGRQFDATEHDTTQNDYAELPNGIYVMQVGASDVTPTKDGTGVIAKITMEVIEPADYEGRKLFVNYNIENRNATAQQIGERQFASLCRAVGVTTPDDTEELHNIAFTVKVGLGKPSKDGQYPARAEVKRYYFPDEGEIPEPGIDENQPAPATAKPANDNKPAARPAAAAAQPAAKPAGRPWGAKK